MLNVVPPYLVMSQLLHLWHCSHPSFLLHISLYHSSFSSPGRGGKITGAKQVNRGGCPAANLLPKEGNLLASVGFWPILLRVIRNMDRFKSMISQLKLIRLIAVGRHAPSQPQMMSLQTSLVSDFLCGSWLCVVLIGRITKWWLWRHWEKCLCVQASLLNLLLVKWFSPGLLDLFHENMSVLLYNI